MSKLILTLALLMFTALSQAPPNWGGNPRYSVKVLFVYNDPVTNWTFNYYYDWSVKAERYEHLQGQYDEVCMLPQTSFKKTGQPCNVIFATDTWFYIQFPT